MSNRLTSLPELIITNVKSWHSDSGDKCLALRTTRVGVMEYWSFGVLVVFQSKQYKYALINAVI